MLHRGSRHGCAHDVGDRPEARPHGEVPDEQQERRSARRLPLIAPRPNQPAEIPLFFDTCRSLMAMTDLRR